LFQNSFYIQALTSLSALSCVRPHLLTTCCYTMVNTV